MYKEERVKHFSRLNKYFIQKYERYLPTAFDESLTLLEKVNKLIEGLNTIVRHINDQSETLEEWQTDLLSDLDTTLDGYVEELNTLKQTYETFRQQILDDILPESTSNILTRWLNDGTLEQIINVNIFNDINTQLTQNQKYMSQFDFVKYVEENTNDYDDIILKKENSAGWFQIILIKGDKHITHQLRPASDGYVILSEMFTGNSTYNETFAQAVNGNNFSGNIVAESQPHYYATTRGDSFDVEIKGDQIEFLFKSDNKGGLWLVTLNDGEDQVRVSVYSDEPVALNRQVIFSNLEDKTHHIKFEFLGADPNHPVPEDVRGWFFFSESSVQSKTLVSSVTRVENSKDFVVAGPSNREFAIQMRPKGHGDYQFVPIHSGTPGVDTINPPKILVNDIEVDTDSMPNNALIKHIKDFKVIQKAYAKNDATENNLAEINTVTSIDTKGKVYITGKMEVLNPIEISDGYGVMINANHNFTDRFISGIDNEYETTLNDGSRTNLVEENDRVASGCFLSDRNPDLILAIRFDDLKRSLRQGEDGKYPSQNMYWIHHRNEFHKLYNSVFKNATLEQGEVFKWKGTYILAEMPNINNLF